MDKIIGFGHATDTKNEKRFNIFGKGRGHVAPELAYGYLGGETIDREKVDVFSLGGDVDSAVSRSGFLGGILERG